MATCTFSFRKTAIGFTAAAALMSANAAHAGDFSNEQCRLIGKVSTEVMKTVGASKLSEQFRTSLVNFVMPEVDGKRTMTCDGPKEILTPTGTDIDAFNTIKDILVAPPAKISLTSAGLRSIDPKALAANERKRTELTLRPGG